ncbi:MAG TPA: recombinase A, partial [Haliangium sp.]|nr:recombinase A [Haliangium sp.]
MTDPGERLRELLATAPVQRADARLAALQDTGEEAWTRDALSGRLTEISGVGAVASLTSAFGLVLDAQTRSEPVAWITLPETSFYPPDAADSGIDLDALAVVCVPGAQEGARAAERLLRSGAFGLIVLDLGRDARVPTALQGRLVSLAKRHDTALVCLTDKPRDAASLGSLVSLRAEVVREKCGADQFSCKLDVLKDKNR